MLQGEKLALREWHESDLDVIVALRNDIKLQALLMTQAKPNSIERVRHWLADRTSREDMVFFVATARNDDRPLGYVQVANINHFHGVGELGICLAPSAQGSNLAQEACQLLDGYLRHTLSLRKLTLNVLADNARAIAFYLKIGYREVGRLKRHFLSDGAYRDVVIMERFLDA